MGKNDFDIDFDFDEEYGFDPKTFLGTEDYNDNIDLDAFSDEELGLTSHTKAEDAEDPAADSLEDDFDLDEDLDTDAFLNMGSEEQTEEEEEDPEAEEDWADELEESDAEESEFDDEDDIFYDEAEEEDADEEEFEEDTDLPEDTEPEEIAMNEYTEYTEEEEDLETSEYEEEAQDETFRFSEEDQDEEQPKKRQKKERKPIQLPKIKLPKLKTPNIFTKFYDLYFAPVLDKNWQNPEDPPQDPNSTKRRRRKTKQQIFKEVYLPPIIACVCLILVLSFLMGSLSNVIEQRRLEKEVEQSRLNESISAAEQQELANQQVLAQAEVLAAGYDYQAALDLLDSLDLTNNQELQAKRSEYVTKRDSLVEYKDPTMIPNLSFHVLIHDLSRALQDTDGYKGNYNKNFVSTAEFSKILEQLYANGYVLVDFNSFVGSKSDVNGNEQFETISMYLPADKKPVMITETMVNYFDYMIGDDDDYVADAKGDGFASKLVLDANGDIKAEYVDANGQNSVGNYDLVPILEDFIKQHPDFSYRGARAILAVTGDEGVFGYRINTSTIASKGQSYHDSEVAGAKQIVQALRDKGYTIACYTYSNKDYRQMNSNTITADLQSWATQVTTVIGNVDTFVFAKMGNLTDYNGSSFDVMYNAGFRYFISNADSPTTTVNSTYVRQNRLMVTGETMQHYSSRFTGMFDCAAILDVNIRGDVPKS